MGKKKNDLFDDNQKLFHLILTELDDNNDLNKKNHQLLSVLLKIVIGFLIFDFVVVVLLIAFNLFTLLF